MKVTKYPQSCLLIEDNGRRLLIDPGSLVPMHFKAADLLPIDAILITHEHPDHADPELIKTLLAAKAVPVIANASTKKLFPDLVTEVVSDGQDFDAAGWKIQARELPHCLMVDGTPGPQNTGYVIEGVLFHPGDGITIENLQVDNTAVPFAGPDISPKDVFDFIKATGAKTIIPIHYDYFTANIPVISQWINRAMPDVKFMPLENGQSTEL